MYEWEKVGHTFHAKQLNVNFGKEGWCLNTIGSSNFSQRSWSRDTEFNLFMFSNSDVFRNKSKLEFENLEKDLVVLDDVRSSQRFMKYGAVDYILGFMFNSFS